MILGLYGAGAVGFGALRSEISESPLLADRKIETGEVLDAFENGHYYLSICGALPLVEFVLSRAAGKWRHPANQPIDKRLFETDAELTDEDMTRLFLHSAATDMLRSQIPELWKSGPHRVGAEVEGLNRHYVLHGTALGWATKGNAPVLSCSSLPRARLPNPC